VKGLLEDPHRVADEYRRRLRQARDEIREPDEIVRLERQMVTLRRGIGRLIDSYAEDVIDKAEFEPRIAGLKQRLSQLQERHRGAVEVAENERDLSLLISRLEDFSAKVTAGLAGLDRAGMRQIIRAVVRRVEIDDANIEIIFRVPPLDGPARPQSPRKSTSTTQHCTDVRRAHICLAQPLSPLGQGLGMPQRQGACILEARLYPHHGQKALQSFMKIPVRWGDWGLC
jgi:site-specific DNA recombinase